jgi:PII-like signaling protein
MSQRQEIIKELLKVYPTLATEFHGSSLIRYIKNRIGNHAIYGDSILRYMRELKAEGKINFKCLNKEKSLYLKIKP